MKNIIASCLTATLLFTSTLSAEFDFSKAPEKMTAYYASGMQTTDNLKARLKDSGFEILSTNEILKGETVVTITNDELKATNSYMAAINILVNPEAKELRVQNPSYLGAAYLKENYKYGQFKATLNSLEKALGQMVIVTEQYDFKKLSKYQFMMGMPYFEDTIEIKDGVNLEEKLKGKKADKYFAYTVKLSNGNTLVGHLLRQKTNKFLKKIDSTNNAQLLPYQAMVDKSGKVVILDPKYYLALSLPLLTMGEFMKIASVPDKIEKGIKRAYK